MKKNFSIKNKAFIWDLINMISSKYRICGKKRENELISEEIKFIQKSVIINFVNKVYYANLIKNKNTQHKSIKLFQKKLCVPFYPHFLNINKLFI